MWIKEWNALDAEKKAQAFKEGQRKEHEDKLARRKEERAAARLAAKIKPEAEYPWLKK